MSKIIDIIEDLRNIETVTSDVQVQLDNKVDDSQVLTDVPAGALFTDTVYDDTSLTNLVNTKADQTSVDTKLNATNPSITGSITEEVSVCTLALEPDNGTVQTYTATSDPTFTDGLAEGQFMTLIYTNGGFTATFPTITWWNGEPTLGTIDKLFFEKVGGVLYGTHVGTIV